MDGESRDEGMFSLGDILIQNLERENDINTHSHSTNRLVTEIPTHESSNSDRKNMDNYHKLLTNQDTTRIGRRGASNLSIQLSVKKILL